MICIVAKFVRRGVGDKIHNNINNAQCLHFSCSVMLRGGAPLPNPPSPRRESRVSVIMTLRINKVICEHCDKQVGAAINSKI